MPFGCGAKLKRSQVHAGLFESSTENSRPSELGKKGGLSMGGVGRSRSGFPLLFALGVKAANFKTRP